MRLLYAISFGVNFFLSNITYASITYASIIKSGLLQRAFLAPKSKESVYRNPWISIHALAFYYVSF